MKPVQCLSMVAGLALLMIAGCRGAAPESPPENAALRFLERFTEREYSPVDLNAVKAHSGGEGETERAHPAALIEGEQRWRVEGTVKDAEGNIYTVRLFVDEGGPDIEAGKTTARLPVIDENLDVVGVQEVAVELFEDQTGKTCRAHSLWMAPGEHLQNGRVLVGRLDEVYRLEAGHP